jgi:biotin operon repressor
MKEYRLTAWPELSPPFHRTAYRRMASDMSHRFMTLPQLADLSGLKRLEVRHFIEMLEGRGLLIERESLAPDSQFWSLRPLGGWIRRAIAASHPDR